MPAIVVPSAAYLRLIWQFNGVDWAINVIGVRNATPIAINQALADTLGAAIKGFFTSSTYDVNVNNQVTLDRVGIRDINAANQAEFIEQTAAVPGSGAGDILPLQTALCITLRTALAGKRYRGRVFLFGITEGANFPGGVVFGSTRTAAVAFINGIGSALSSAGLELAVVSQVGGFATPVSLVQSRDANWASQRRRRSSI